MSSLINISQLPTADEVISGDYFIIDNTVVTKKINFSNIIFGLDNVTFASTISAHSTEINTLSSNLTTLSAQEATDVNNLYSAITTAVQSATASLTNLLYPVNSIKITFDSTNPGTTLVGTSWQQIAQGCFLAGVGTLAGGDKNGNFITVSDESVGGGRSANLALGEYLHVLQPAEIAPHTHPFVGYVNGGSAYLNTGPGGILSDHNPAVTSANNGGSPATGHNNVPPLFGVYVWQRIA